MRFPDQASKDGALSNGAPMRIAPAALLDDDQERERVVRQDTALTNLNDECLDAGSVKCLRQAVLKEGADEPRGAVRQVLLERVGITCTPVVKAFAAQSWMCERTKDAS